MKRFHGALSWRAGRYLALISLLMASTLVRSEEVIVVANSDQTIALLEAEGWWGPERHDTQLIVPRLITTGISDRWRTSANSLPVATKKEIFYRLMLPLALHANSLVMARRAVFERMLSQSINPADIAPDDVQSLREIAGLLRIINTDQASVLTATSDNLVPVLNEVLYRLDVVPPGLVLGQAAYESGYGTSRFAAQGNSLFGQWSFGGEGLVPHEQRAGLGDHRIAAFEWPFDSVRSYFLNLSSHPAYADFRRIRAELKVSGQPVTSVALAGGLESYSERGAEYVETLRGIITHNNLAIADKASFRDEPLRFLVGAEDEAQAVEIRAEIVAARESGMLDSIIARMTLN